MLLPGAYESNATLACAVGVPVSYKMEAMSSMSRIKISPLASSPTHRRGGRHTKQTDTRDRFSPKGQDAGP
jgi:hypothetical protein